MRPKQADCAEDGMKKEEPDSWRHKTGTGSGSHTAKAGAAGAFNMTSSSTLDAEEEDKEETEESLCKACSYCLLTLNQGKDKVNCRALQLSLPPNKAPR